MDTLKTTRDRVQSEFKRIFRDRPRLFRSPGRVNMIGEHTDYNEGFVLPVAIDRETVVAARRRDDRTVFAFAIDKGESASIDLDSEPIKRRGTWMDYVEGTIRSLDEKYSLPHGADLVFSGSIPIGSGLSSSASLEVSIGLATTGVCDIEVDLKELAFAAQKAEHHYVGTRSGIMDQFASVFGRKSNAVLIDCRALTTQYVPLNIDGAEVIVSDTGVHHNLASSEYNLRRSECDQAVAILKNHLPHVGSLRDVTQDDLDHLARYLTTTLRMRSRHVVSENKRTREAAEALENGDLRRVGELMYESHESLRDDYQVSAPELDELVEIARDTDGVYGSRMTGGGFGGATISIVAREAVDNFRERSVKGFKEKFGSEPKIFQVRASEGACEL